MRKAEVLELKDGDRAELEKIVKIRTEQAQVVARARILLRKGRRDDRCNRRQANGEQDLREALSKEVQV